MLLNMEKCFFFIGNNADVMAVEDETNGNVSVINTRSKGYFLELVEILVSLCKQIPYISADI